MIKLVFMVWTWCVCETLHYAPPPSSPSSKVMANVKVNDLNYMSDLWPWRMTFALTGHPWKCMASWDTPACQISYLYTGSKVMANVKVWVRHAYKQTDRQGKKQYAHQICILGHTNLRTNWHKIHFCWILYEFKQSVSD